MVSELITYVVDEHVFNRFYRPSMAGRFNDAIMCVKRPSKNNRFLLLADKGRIVAAAKYHACQVFPQQIYLEFLQTAEDRYGYGYGGRLFSKIFDHAVALERPTVILSHYTEAGKRHLLPMERAIKTRLGPRISIVHEPSY